MHWKVVPASAYEEGALTSEQFRELVEDRDLSDETIRKIKPILDRVRRWQ